MSEPTNPPQLGRTIRLFLVDGSANGVITAEIMNWTGHAVMGPRSKVSELVNRGEARKTGVYFLSGTGSDGSGTSVYIGEGDDVGKRLHFHATDPSKDFWEKACFITSKDQNLTKAHGRYLESRLIEIASRTGRANVVNSTRPEPIRLPETDVSDMEYFIDQIRLILPVLGMEFLRPTLSSDPKVESHKTVFELKSKKHAIEARAVERDDEFIVLKGSKAQPSWIGVGSEDHSYRQLHSALIRKQKIRETDGSAVFEHDIAFKSPSAAAAVVLGRPSNGRIEWRVQDTKKTYADWQNELLDALKDSH